jgi:hypothetical protein
MFYIGMNGKTQYLLLFAGCVRRNSMQIERKSTRSFALTRLIKSKKYLRSIRNSSNSATYSPNKWLILRRLMLGKLL